MPLCYAGRQPQVRRRILLNFCHFDARKQFIPRSSCLTRLNFLDQGRWKNSLFSAHNTPFGSMTCLLGDLRCAGSELQYPFSCQRLADQPKSDEILPAVPDTDYSRSPAHTPSFFYGLGGGPVLGRWSDVQLGHWSVPGLRAVLILSSL
jgi:hypothetical protein